MDGWRVDPQRLRALRELAEIKAVDLARLVNCHHRHYRKFEAVQVNPDTGAVKAAMEPSVILANVICRTLGEALGRNVTFTDFAHEVPYRRRTVA